MAGAVPSDPRGVAPRGGLPRLSEELWSDELQGAWPPGPPRIIRTMATGGPGSSLEDLPLSLGHGRWRALLPRTSGGKLRLVLAGGGPAWFVRVGGAFGPARTGGAFGLVRIGGGHACSVRIGGAFGPVRIGG